MKSTYILFLISLLLLLAEGEPLKVYILAGQSNMVGDGSAKTFPAIAQDPETRSLYEKMFNKKGEPRVSEQVRISYLNGRMKEEGTVVSGKLTAGFGRTYYVNKDLAPFIGPELAFGMTMEEAHEGPVLLIKVAWGGQSLHTDFRPPRVESDEGGKRYQQLIHHVQDTLKNLKDAHPSYEERDGYEIAGFAWFQGWNDFVDRKVYPDELGEKQYEKYSELMEAFILDVRKDLEAPEMPFVIGVMGIHGDFQEGSYRPMRGLETRMKRFRAAMAAPASSKTFKGTVSAVDTTQFWNAELGMIDQKRSKVKAFRAALKAKKKGSLNEDGSMSVEEQRASTEAFEKDILTEEERKLWEREASVGGFVHYFGSAKFYSRTGEALAKALLEL